MAKDQLPGFWEIRRLLYSKDVSSGEVSAAADKLAAAERYSDALDCYERAENMGKVLAVSERAFAEGDVGVWLKGKRILKESVQPEEWQKIAAVALMSGKEHFALFAYRRAGDEAKVEEIRRGMLNRKGPPPSGGPVSEGSPA